MTGVDRAVNHSETGLDQEKVRLRKATKEFESLFMYQLLQSMRKTIPKNDTMQGSTVSGSFGKDTFMDMFDMHLSRKMSGGNRSIADMLYATLEPLLESKVSGKSEAIELKPLRSKPSNPLDLKAKPVQIVPDQTVFPLNIKSQPHIQSLIRNKATRGDSIIDRYGLIVDEAARTTTVDSALICAVIKAESDGNPNAISSTGAKGLMQLMDDTAAELGVQKVFDPRDNILSGSRYLGQMLKRYDGDTKLALAAYNAGPGNVDRHGGIPPFPETRAYVDRVMEKFAFYRSVISPIDAKVP